MGTRYNWTWTFRKMNYICSWNFTTLIKELWFFLSTKGQKNRWYQRLYIGDKIQSGTGLPLRAIKNGNKISNYDRFPWTGHLFQARFTTSCIFEEMKRKGERNFRVDLVNAPSMIDKILLQRGETRFNSESEGKKKIGGERWKMWNIKDLETVLNTLRLLNVVTVRSHAQTLAAGQKERNPFTS